MTFENILIIDDAPSLCRSMEQHLRRQRYMVSTAGTLTEGAALLEREHCDLLFLGLPLPDGNASTLLAQLTAGRKPPVAVILSSFNTADEAIRCLRAGAFDCLPRTPAPTEIDSAIRQAEASCRSAQLNRYLKQELSGESVIHGDSEPIRQLRACIENTASTDSAVLISGESGVGKRRVARAVYRAGARAQNHLVRVNCASGDENSVQHQLFGGETRHRDIGRVELAHGGTLLLENVSELPPRAQTRLLHAIQEGEYARGDCSKPVTVDVRIVATTQHPLADSVARGTFQAELYSILNGVTLQVPSLRERICDLPVLASNWLEKCARRHGSHRGATLSDEVLRRLMAYSWPGNIRELENALERAAILNGFSQPIDAGVFDFLQLHHSPSEAGVLSAGSFTETNEPLLTLDELEKRQVFRALEFTKQNRTKAATLLQISVRTLRNKLHRYRAEAAAEAGILQQDQGKIAAPTGSFQGIR